MQILCGRIVGASCLIVIIGIFSAHHVKAANDLTPDKLYLEQKKICEGLSADECFANSNCQGAYGPSFTNQHMTTTDWVFKQCVPSTLSVDEIQQIKKECDKMNGEFRKNRTSGYECLCTKPNFIGRSRCLEELIMALRTKHMGLRTKPPQNK